MNKKLLIVLGVIILVLGLFFILQQKGNKADLNNNSANQQNNNENLGNNNQNLYRENISMVCSYKIENGLEVTTYIKNKMIKTVTNMPNDINYNLVKDDKAYQWSDKDKKGIVMPIVSAQKQSGTGVEIENPEKYIDDIMKYRPNCKETNLSDDIFIVPQDVQFQDMSQLFGL